MEPKEKYEISGEEKNFFDENGFVFLKNVLSSEETAAYREIIDKVVKDRTKDDKRTLAERTPYEREFLQCAHLWGQYPDVKTLTLSPRLGSLAAQLLGADHVRLWHDQALYKVPGGDATQPHLDLSYWPMLDRKAGTIWIALEEVTVEMGAMHFIPGSHNAGIDGFDHRIEDALEGRSSLLEKVSEKLKADPVSYNLKPGDATFHHGLTIHFTGKNSTDKIRKGMTVIYFADGVRFNAESPASGHHCAEGSRHGEPIATPKNPIIV